MDVNPAEEILDILFDKDDPILKDVDCNIQDDLNLKDIDCNMEMDILETFDNTKASQNNDWTIEEKTLLNFLKELENDDFECKIPKITNESVTPPLLNSTSPSSSSGSDKTNEEIGFLLNSDSSTYNIENESFSLSENSTACSSNVTFLNFVKDSPLMDIGADVIVVTTETSDKELNEEDSNNSKMSSISLNKNRSRYLGHRYSALLEGPVIHNLTEEEKKLIKKEGLIIPTDRPLTKAEERELKKIRRKIRNKHSAQESRQRKKKYIDELENKLMICSSQNKQLEEKVQTLEKQTFVLRSQLKKFHSFISKSSAKSVETCTCLMILLLSFSLFLIPSLYPNSLELKELLPSKHKMPPVAGRSRSLLYSSENSESVSTAKTKGKIFQENTSNGDNVIPEKIPLEAFNKETYHMYQEFKKLEDNSPSIKKNHDTLPKVELQYSISYGSRGGSLEHDTKFVSINNISDSNQVILNLKE